MARPGSLVPAAAPPPRGHPGSRALRGGKRSSAGRHLVGGGAGPGPPRALPVGAAPAPPHSPLPTERSGAAAAAVSAIGVSYGR